MIGCRERSQTPDADSGTSEPTPTTEIDRLVRLRNLGMAYLDVGLTAEAARTFEELTDAAPNEPMGWYNRALIAMRRDKLDSAREFLDRAQQLAGRRPDILELAGAIAAMDGRHTEAADLLSQAIALDSEDVRLRYALFEVLRHSPDPKLRETGGEQLGAMIALRPDNLELRIAAARAALDRGDVNAATPHINALSVMDIEWPTEPIDARTLVEQLQQAVEKGDATAARRPLLQLRNILAPGVAFRDAHRELATPAGEPGHPLWKFLSVEIVPPSAAPPN
ncbi:MAG: tetratricopeptide repeat protein, partial [Planctomycetes bacterium]|nr:tetratricopeptide repeat protein [Planctomycetota bacterium]